MHLSADNLFTALLWAAIAGLAGWVLCWPVRRRSFIGLLASVVVTGTAALVGAVLGAMHAMLLPTADLTTIMVLGLGAGLMATLAAATAARRWTRDRQSLSEAIRQLGTGEVPAADGPRLGAELGTLRRELDATAAALAETRERERALESARRDLVSWVSHDLRTPLAGLRAMSEALEDGVVDNPEQYYKQIGASVDQLSGMVDDLFDLSRIQAGAMSKHLDTLSLDDLVSDCLAALTPLAHANRVRLSGSSAATPGRTAIAGNGPELNRALTNLIVNAIRHTREDGTVEVHVDVLPSALAEVEVRDECGGIPEADLARVFEVGFRGEAARTPHAGHTASGGLGLAITRGIVEAHAGTVEVENAGAGCRFRVLLPVAS